MILLYDCDRCGRTCIGERTHEKMLERKKIPLCPDCQLNTLFRVVYSNDYCVPHQGFFDKEDWPVDNFGVRLYADLGSCGHSDCIKASHHADKQLVKFVQPRHRKKLLAS